MVGVREVRRRVQMIKKVASVLEDYDLRREEDSWAEVEQRREQKG